MKWYFGPSVLLPEVPELARPPQPLVNRCWCGKPISNSRRSCAACAEAEIIRIAACIRTQEALDTVLSRFEGEERAEFLRAITPHLRLVSPDKAQRYLCGVCGWMEDEVVDVCPSCGAGSDPSDFSKSPMDLRIAWVSAGAKWFGSTPPPEGWDGIRQLANLNGIDEQYAAAMQQAQKILAATT